MDIRVVSECVPGFEPVYASERSAGADLRAHIPAEIDLPPGARMLVPTGVRLAIPEGFEGQVRPRSGLAVRDGLTVLNAPGTIDSDYRGEVSVILVNLGPQNVRIGRGDRIAQLIIAPVSRAQFVPGQLSETSRGSGGFGSTGVQ
ncbi:MAG TPA: dUTP diphosphatase [Spirochaetia bacterium]|nr:dUTP diphosphatase [Spirochaetia bacterium]